MTSYKCLEPSFLWLEASKYLVCGYSYIMLELFMLSLEKENKKHEKYERHCKLNLKHPWCFTDKLFPVTVMD